MASLNEMPNRQKGAILMCASAFLFSAMQIPINMSGTSIPIMEQVFFRNIVTLFLSFILIKRSGGSLFGKKENQPLLFVRSLFGFLGLITQCFNAYETLSFYDNIMGRCLSQGKNQKNTNPRVAYSLCGCCFCSQPCF